MLAKHGYGLGRGYMNILILWKYNFRWQTCIYTATRSGGC